MEESKIIDRPLYTDRLKKHFGNNLIKILTGQRRVGKSYILKYMASYIRSQDPKANIININLEDFAFSHIREASALHEEVTAKIISGHKNYILIDEIQEVKDFERVVRSLALESTNDIYITGSNSSMLSSEIASRLAGRSVEIRIHPLSYLEFLEFHSLSVGDETLMQYLQYGGLPYLKNLRDTSDWGEYIEGIADAVVYRDIVARHSIRNNDFLQRLMLFLADNIGQIFSAKKISDYLKSQRTQISVTGVQNYLLYICEAYILNQCRRWDIEGKRFLEIGEKYYFEDLGIRNSLVGFKPDHLGGVIENAVFNHLCIQGYRVKTGQLVKGCEIDFIAEKKAEIVYIQVALTIKDDKTRVREFGNLELLNDNYRKLVVTLNESYPNTLRGIETYNLLEFLTGFK